MNDTLSKENAKSAADNANNLIPQSRPMRTKLMNLRNHRQEIITMNYTVVSLFQKPTPAAQIILISRLRLYISHNFSFFK